jgi:outer membrane lipoprotein-sorting protein
MLRLSCLLLPLLFAGGCTRAERLPAYRWVDDRAALRALADRARTVHTASAECALTLTRPDGESVRLDGALVMKPPGSVRLRAWKFNQAVFDLTLTPDGIWVLTPDDSQRRDKVLPASINAGKMARAWALFAGEFFAGDDLIIHDTGGPRFQVERSIDGQRVVCEVERATLTPRRYTVLDQAGAARFTLTAERYEDVHGIVWPVWLDAHSDGGRIQIELHDVELNGELMPGAFTPPRRAQRIP